jgi:hypothetical protein
MEVNEGTLNQIYEDIVNSVGYKTTVGPIDKGKVSRRRAGEQTKLPSARIARAAWRTAALLAPLAPPPPPPPPAPKFKRVAPITVREEGGSDQRVCLWSSAGVLHPGVTRLSSGEYTDESGAVYSSDGDGLENSGVRPKVNDPRLVGARSMDGRSACDCPPVGDPSNNTGSWAV